MEIVVKGRNTEIPERFRTHVEEKVAKVESLSNRIQRVDVELTHERNPRQADTAERIELTVRGKGPVIRAEASASDRYGALDLAMGKLLERIRRHRDKRKDHHRAGQPVPPELLVPGIADNEPETEDDGLPPDQLQAPSAPGETTEGTLGDSPVLVRQKMHEAVPMTVDQALYQMELVGHDFFLFIDDATGQPCVCYRRRGWTYGIIRLNDTVKGWQGDSQGQAALEATV